MKWILLIVLVIGLTSCGCNREQSDISSDDVELRVSDNSGVEEDEEQLCLAAGETGSIGGVPGDDGWKLIDKCCEGLEDREAIEVCGKGIAGGYIYVCIACGDGQCENDFENKCNCPEDCKG